MTPTALPADGLKSNVAFCRLDNEILAAVDTLVEAGIRPSRSDAVAWLLATEIAAHHELFARIQTTLATIRELRAGAAEMVRPACPPAEA